VPNPTNIRVILLDVEGTTTPIAFVHDVLFPYAREAVGQYLANASPTDPDIRKIVDGLRQERAQDVANGDDPPAWSRESDVVNYVRWLIDRDRKSGPLKTLQGLIWERGYAVGELRGEVYPDVRPAFERWTAAGLGIGIFSSGSVLAQKLLFGSTGDGDLTPFLRWHFDTAVGPKRNPTSYEAIAAVVGQNPGAILFISDVEQELDAARAAGLQTRLCIRPPATAPPATPHPIVTTFD
jgi:enolase-phosphatase E1